jgi:hypothetical protein
MGLALLLAGFVAVGVGWARMADKDCVQCQLPYLLSGGAMGLGLITLGIAMLMMAQMRMDSRRLASQLAALHELFAAEGEEPSHVPPGSLDTREHLVGAPAPASLPGTSGNGEVPASRPAVGL